MDQGTRSEMVMHPGSQLSLSPLGHCDNFSEIYHDIQISFGGNEGLMAFLKCEFSQQSFLWASHRLLDSKRMKLSLAVSFDEAKALRVPSTTQSCGGGLLGVQVEVG